MIIAIFLWFYHRFIKGRSKLHAPTAIPWPYRIPQSNWIAATLIVPILTVIATHFGISIAINNKLKNALDPSATAQVTQGFWFNVVVLAIFLIVVGLKKTSDRGVRSDYRLAQSNPRGHSIIM
jgi:hypothetical protein